MRFIKFIKKYPFLFMIIISTMIVSSIGFAGKSNIYSSYPIALIKTPQLAAVLEGVGEKKYPWMIVSAKGKDEKEAGNKKTKETDGKLVGKKTSGKNATAEDTRSKAVKSKDQLSTKVGEAGEENSTSEDVKGNKVTKVQNNHKADSKSVGNNKADKNKAVAKNKADKGKAVVNTTTDKNSFADKETTNIDNKDENKVAMDHSDQSWSITTDEDTGKTADDKDGVNNTADFQNVTEDYFSDALFIGDSRTVGLSEYSGWSKPTFYADVGLTIYDIFSRKIAEEGSHKVTVLEALKDKQFKKIYIMVGINELGRGTTKTFIDEYKKVLKKIQKLQPDSIIYVEGIMKVSNEKSDADPIFNNTNIIDKNNHIAKLANNKNIYYIDVNEAITDKTGSLPAKYTFDNIHLKAAYYKLWTDFLLKHGIITKE